MTGARRLLFYSHNGVGIGHVQRQLRLAVAYRRRHPDVSVLIVTGSHAAGTLRFPAGIDYLKLPSIRMTDRYRTWEPRDVSLRMADLTRLRSDLVRTSVRRFRPHLMVADFMPAGPYGELLPALAELSRRGAMAVAGFRDIIDEPGFVRELWQETGVYEVLREHYAAVCVYGTQDVTDFRDYGLAGDGGHPADQPRAPTGGARPPPADPPIHYAGYLVEPPRGNAPTQADGPAPLIVATTGGGVDGGPLLQRFVGAARYSGTAGTWLAVAGPLLADDEFSSLVAAGGRVGVRVVRTVRRMGALLAAADVVVAMAGYNTICELLACSIPAVIVPAARESGEQRLRGQTLERWGRARVLDCALAAETTGGADDAAGARVLAGAIEEALARGPAATPPVALGGMSSALDLFERLAGGALRPARQTTR